MTLMAVVPAFLMSESFLSRDRLPLVFFNSSIKRKRQESVMSNPMNDTREIACSKFEWVPAFCHLTKSVR